MKSSDVIVQLKLLNLNTIKNYFSINIMALCKWEIFSIYGEYFFSFNLPG